MAHGTILLLNGPSSSGKTTLARALQAIWPGPLLLVGIDMIISMLPFAYTGKGAHAAEGFAMISEKDDAGPSTRLAIGPKGRSLNRKLAELTAILAADGFDVLVDHIITDDETLTDFVHELPADRSWFVGVHCDAEVLAQRETARGDRFSGTARAQLASVHAGPRFYDLELDTTRSDTGTLATQIVTMRLQTPSAFRALAAHFRQG